VIILHVSICDGIPWLWGEQDRGSQDKVLRPCRYDPGLKGLRSALKQIVPGIGMQKRYVSMVTVWLPSRGDAPIPSSPLIGPSPDRRRKVTIRPSVVLARKLSMEELLELVSMAESDVHTHAGILLGTSFLWCSRLLALALNIVVKETFIPGIIHYDGAYEARWLPVPDEKDEWNLAALATSMPGICRAMGDTPNNPPETHPRQTMNHLLARMVDAVVRRAHSSEALKLHTGSYTSLHDAWLTALASEKATVRWDDAGDLQKFSQELVRWQRPIDLVAKSPFKFVFRLSEPDDDALEDIADRWQVEYLLQPKSDPSLMIPVSELWRKDKDAVAGLKEFGSDATEFLLTALGQAAGLCPEVAASLKTRNPGGFTCDAAGACRFLQEQAQALRSVGFIVLLPAWWVSRGVVKRLSLTARAKSPAMQGGGA